MGSSVSSSLLRYMYKDPTKDMIKSNNIRGGATKYLEFWEISVGNDNPGDH